MALHWDLSRIKDYKELCWIPDGDDELGCVIKRMNSRTETLLFATMIIGMNEITEKNWKEFYFRIHMCELTYGPYFRREEIPEYYTPDMIHKHIGLGTNASNLTKVKFRNKVWEYSERECERAVTRFEETRLEKVS
jgi:hypothetical protein